MKTSVFVGMSVDGFIARRDDTLDFLDTSDGTDGGSAPSHGYEEFIASVDALVMGRRTYEVVLGFKAWHYGTKPVFVLSKRRLRKAPKGAVVERLSGEPARIIAELEKRGFGHLYIDGGATVQRFLAAGLIDRLVLSRVPVLIGKGISLFGKLPHDVRLRHIVTRTFPGGLMQTEYTVLPNPGAA
jgi:dihydrofolate reductase